MVWHSVFPVFTMASTILVIMAIMVPTMVESSPPGLLVVGGGGSPTTAEFLLPGNLSSPPYSCTLPQLPRHLRYHTLDMWDNQVATVPHHTMVHGPGDHLSGGLLPGPG